MIKNEGKTKDFLDKLEWEGGIASLVEYFGEEDLKKLEDKKLSKLTIAAREKMVELDAYIEELQEQYEEMDGNNEDDD